MGEGRTEVVLLPWSERADRIEETLRRAVAARACGAVALAVDPGIAPAIVSGFVSAANTRSGGAWNTSSPLKGSSWLAIYGSVLGGN